MADNRPLSPHLGIYRWQITMTMSILHRATGVALAVGSIALVWWLVAAGIGPDAFDTVHRFLSSGFGQFLLIGWTFSLFFHLCNGVRHLAWDAGWGFQIKTFYITGYLVWVVSVLLTAGTLWVAYTGGAA
ncbi:MAG TPA: succinate dehydrogenase, cytochrome b556 subunit [Gammaproteobacteria bacterium]|jgi:succinate dehydrogenase / fumarate reductase cytochrome b subunit|nr:succinate dehydrogenase, cytochrome b556 subunit [Gammaproteobacteria bacterium]